MYIERIEVLEKGKRRLFFENGQKLILYKGELASYGLKEGGSISEDIYQELLCEVVGKRAKKRTMHLLERQERTEYQLREKLKQNEYPKEVIEDAISYVKKYHYVDDYRYACNYIRYQQEKKSRRRLWQDLIQKGVDKQMIERAFEEEGNVDEKAAIRRLLEKKGYHADMTKQEANKVYQFLLRRGYQSSDILYVMRSEYLT